MAVLATIEVPSKSGPRGLRVPADHAVAVEAVRLARAMVESLPAGPAYLQNRYGAWPTDSGLDFGPVEEDAAWSQVARLLASPPEGTAPWSVSWSIRGCEVYTDHWSNDEPDPIVALHFRLHGNVDPIARALERAVGTLVSPVEDDDRLFDLTMSGVSLCFFEYSPDEQDGLYGDASRAGTETWLRTRVSERPSQWDTLHASSPVLRPSAGGFLEFFADTCARVRGGGLLVRALRDHGLGGPRRWFVMRWAIPVGQCALPTGVLAGSRADIISFLHDPASLDAGSVQMDSWSGVVAYEWEHRRRIGWRRVWTPGYTNIAESDAFSVRIETPTGASQGPPLDAGRLRRLG